jgi:2,5-dioxopentanoate dehydrogenase
VNTIRMEINGKNFIGNERLGEGLKFRAMNPANGLELPTDFSEGTLSEVNTAIVKATEAFSIYRKKSGKEKADFLESMADAILALGDTLIKRCADETGLPEMRLIGERTRTVMQLKLFATVLREGSWVDARIDTADASRSPAPKPDVRSMLRPLGPVGIFGASNFPLAFSVAGGDTASALAAGCSVIVKAHPAHPGTSELVASAIIGAANKTGMPDGVFSMVHGKSIDVGVSIVRHPMIKAIAFTGSFKAGKAIFDEANKRSEPIPVYAEMGSSNPVFILPEAMALRGEQIARDLVASVLQGVGQFCTNPGLVVLQNSPARNSFIEAMKVLIAAGAAGVMLSQGIRNNYSSGIHRLSNTPGVELIATGKEVGNEHQGTPALFETNAANFLRDHILEEEVFGPSSLLVTADNHEYFLRAAENLSGHLTATIHGTEKDLVEYSGLIEMLEQKVGRLIINGYPTGVEVCHSMVHGGPFPATTDSRSTSVGSRAITRFARPVCYQNFPQSLLPDELQDSNPMGIRRLWNGQWTAT